MPELYESAVREAVAAFGRGECFVERYLDDPRHVETQMLADKHGNVVVVSTRDCSLQRRHQKLVEEAPAPFLTDAQLAELYRASKAIIREAGYDGAGTCEFLVGRDGMISFLEVNTRLQVEHPVSEEVAGIDLVREQFRIAGGRAAGLRRSAAAGPLDRVPDQRRGPRPGLPAGSRCADACGHLPAGRACASTPGSRRATSSAAGFDSLLAKLVVTGRDRQEALERARRALDEFAVEGIATALTFHRAVVRDPAFAPADPAEPFRVHTRWIETEFDNTIPAYVAAAAPAEPAERRTITVEVDGKRLEVVLPADLGGGRCRRPRRRCAPGRPPDRGARLGRRGDGADAGHRGQGRRRGGSDVAAGDLVVVLEAMKMEQPLTAHKAGTVTGLSAEVGATVPSGTVLCEILP